MNVNVNVKVKAIWASKCGYSTRALPSFSSFFFVFFFFFFFVFFFFVFTEIPNRCELDEKEGTNLMNAHGKGMERLKALRAFSSFSGS